MAVELGRLNKAVDEKSGFTNLTQYFTTDGNNCMELKTLLNETSAEKDDKVSVGFIRNKENNTQSTFSNFDEEANLCKTSKKRTRCCIGATIGTMALLILGVVIYFVLFDSKSMGQTTFGSSRSPSGANKEDNTPLKQLLITLKHPGLYETFNGAKIEANNVRKLNANDLTDMDVDSETAQSFLQVVDEENNLRQHLMEMKKTNFLDILWKNDVRTENLMGLDIGQLTTFGFTIGDRISFFEKVKTFLKDLKTEILTAAENGDVEGIKRTLKKAKEFNIYKQILNSQNEKGWSALFTAIANRKEDVAHLLLNFGCEVNTSINEQNGELEGSTPLILASFDGMTEIVEKLIENGAVINAMQKDKTDSAFVAAQEGHLETLKLLLDKDSSVSDRQGFNGRTPLGAAAFKGHLDIVKYLIENYNPRINVQEDNNDTPLMIAAYFNRPQVVKYLLSKRADKSIEGWQGKTALEQTTEKNNTEVIKILEEHVEQGNKL